MCKENDPQQKSCSLESLWYMILPFEDVCGLILCAIYIIAWFTLCSQIDILPKITCILHGSNVCNSTLRKKRQEKKKLKANFGLKQFFNCLNLRTIFLYKTIFQSKLKKTVLQILTEPKWKIFTHSYMTKLWHL